MHPARWSVFFSLLGLTTLLPAYFVPAMLVANAVDGSQWFSVWTGISAFWQRGHYFLSGLIFTFSFLFPLVKFSLCLVSAAGGGWLSPSFRRRVVKLTEWTAKYSMLDVFVIAMLVLLVKVEEYIRILPSLGLYLFSFAVLCSVLSSGFLLRALHPPGYSDPEMPSAPQVPATSRRWPFLPWLIAGAAVAVCGIVLAVSHAGGTVESISLTNLTKRPVPRTVEKVMGLRELGKAEHKFWSKDTLRRLLETVQTATTDAGWNKPQGYLVVETPSGQEKSSQIEVDFDNPNLQLEFTLARPVEKRDIKGLRFVTRVEYLGLMPAEVEEETLSVANDPYRTWTADWYGRIFQFRLTGKVAAEFHIGLLLGISGLVLFYWAGSGLLCGRRRN